MCRDFFMTGQRNDLFNLQSGSVDENVVQAPVEPPHVVRVGGLPAGAEQLEGVAQGHAAPLVLATGAPVLVVLGDAAAADEAVRSRRRRAVEVSAEYDGNAGIQIARYVPDVRQGYSDLDETDVPTYEHKNLLNASQ